ncbi:hypothetical protein SAMN02745127_03119 [Oceanospirillum multiglobuliferum]|uniref:Reverse transcriptase domain-containing protein n=1 Tax=Oceanospirillum multiglobuliferum TaxID=64969 RepID=A0A1T4SJM7_9GAMM|nr:hypothetical protein BTE48_15425 [Oceanospirillum multiglobuliferum]SKA28373.1 hypothetical protein SAMN02745127_03119 [Oceanospirillum multiglobuliferum]
MKIEKFLEGKFRLFYGQEYEIIRYVDDYIIYSNSEDMLDVIVKAVGDQLSEFNLFLNDSKFEKFSRPILTDNSSLIISVKSIVSELDKVVFSLSENAGENEILNRIRNIHSVKLAFVDKVKRACMLSSSGYGVASSFLISVFGRRINRVIRQVNKKVGNGIDFNSKDYVDEAISVRSALQLFMELIFYFYSVSPTLNSSTNLSKSIIVIDRFIADFMPEQLDYLRTSFSFEVENILRFEDCDGYLDNYISLEKMNILLSVSGYDLNKYGVDLSIIESIINTSKKELGYFEIISLLYYCKDNAKYEAVNKIIQKKCSSYLDEYLKKDSLYTSSEALHLSLDIITCPYIKDDIRKKALRLVLISARKKNNSEVLQILDRLKDRYWFVKWKGGDIYSLLERKSLRFTY